MTRNDFEKRLQKIDGERRNENAPQPGGARKKRFFDTPDPAGLYWVLLIASVLAMVVLEKMYFRDIVGRGVLNTGLAGGAYGLVAAFFWRTVFRLSGR